MAIHYPTAPARAGERGRTPSPHLYAREAPVISPDELEAPDAGRLYSRSGLTPPMSARCAS